jgi:diguanylate cyclase (GGDEF)-like protein
MDQFKPLSQSEAMGKSSSFFEKIKANLNIFVFTICLVAAITSGTILTYLLSDPSVIRKTHLAVQLMTLLSWASLISGVTAAFFLIRLSLFVNRITAGLSQISKTEDYKNRLDKNKFPMLGDLVSMINLLIEQVDIKDEKIEEMSAIIDQREQENQVLWLEIEHNLCLAKEEAETDGLTKLYNRKSAEIRLSEEFEKATVNKNPLSVLMCDLDHFKSVNDTFGHEVGDEVLRLFADILREAIRSDDTAARYGGEEFIVLLHGAPGLIGKQVAERINEAFEKAVREKLSSEYPKLRCTVSLGIADYPTCTTAKDKLVSMADIALYQAKETGRNRVVYYDEIDTSKRKEAV